MKRENVMALLFAWVAAASAMGSACTDEMSGEVNDGMNGEASGERSEAPTPVEPVVDGVTATVVPASPRTEAALSIAEWRYQATAAGTVVRGVSADGAARVAFWVEMREGFDGMIAHASATPDAALVPRLGEVRGGSEALRAQVTAFRADVEAAEKTGPRHVNDDVTLCYGQQGSFPTWFFGNTTIIVTHPGRPSGTVYFTFQAGGAAAELHSVATGKHTAVARIFGALPVTVKHYLPSDGACVRVQIL